MNARSAVLVRLLLLVVVVAGGFELGIRRLAIGFDGQAVRCLPWRVYLIDRTMRSPRRLTFVAFRARGLAPLIADDTLLVKQVIGMPGDRVQIRDGRYRINGVERARVDPALLARWHPEIAADGRERVLAEGEYAVLGRHPSSYDSRYFGAVTAVQVVGEATPLW